MSLRVPRISKLQEDVVSRLRSSFTISSLTQCLRELLQNSLDASESLPNRPSRPLHIDVKVDLGCMVIHVADNGPGIPQNELQVCGERYHTSKCRTLADLEAVQSFGFRGEALASVAEVSLLEIHSRYEGSTQGYQKIMKGGKLLNYGPSTLQREIGTTVIIRDLFWNLPVRKKMLNPAMEIERIKRVIEEVALVRPKVSLSLFDISRRMKLVSTNAAPSTLATFRQLHGHMASFLEETLAQEDGYTLSGLLSKKGYHNKNFQFLYVNDRMIQAISSDIYKLINRLFAHSLFWKQEIMVTHQNKYHPITKKRFYHPKRSQEKFPVFVLFLKCPPNTVDIFLDPAKNVVEFHDWSVIQHLIEATVNGFLVEHGLLNPLEAAASSQPQGGKGGGDQGHGSSEDFSDGDEMLEDFAPSQTSLSGNALLSDTEGEGDEHHQSTPLSQEALGLIRYPLMEDDDEGGCETEDCRGKGDEPGQFAGRSSPPGHWEDRGGKEESPPPLVRKRRITLLEDNGRESQEDDHDIQVPLSLEIEHSHSQPEDTSRSSAPKRPRLEAGFEEMESGMVLDDATGNSSQPQQISQGSPKMMNLSTEGEAEAPAPLKPSEWMAKKAPPTEIKRKCMESLREYSSKRTPQDPSAVTLEDSTKAAAKETFRAVIDTSTGKTCYINSKTGNSFFSLLGKSKGGPRLESPLHSGDEDDSPPLLASSRSSASSPSPLKPAGFGLLNRGSASGSASVKKIIEQESGKQHHRFSQGVNADDEDDHQHHHCHQEGGEDEGRDRPESIEALFKEWKNPVFEYPPTQIPKLNHGNLSKFGHHFTPGYLPSDNTLTKDLLTGIEVIGQVDNKFIACRTGTAPQMILFIDQHAADERVRLERFTKEYLGTAEKDDPADFSSSGKRRSVFNDVTGPGVETIAVNEPIGFELSLTDHDAQLFSMYQGNFRKWGVHGAVRFLRADDGVMRQVVFIKRMPKMIGDKFDTAPGIIQDLVKTHLMLLEETNGMAATCPVGIRRLLDGRACRGAIKFGDSLSHEECQRVVSNLSKCDFPFQCAHGRPSMIPLLQLDFLKKARRTHFKTS